MLLVLDSVVICDQIANLISTSVVFNFCKQLTYINTCQQDKLMILRHLISLLYIDNFFYKYFISY